MTTKTRRLVLLALAAFASIVAIIFFTQKWASALAALSTSNTQTSAIHPSKHGDFNSNSISSQTDSKFYKSDPSRIEIDQIANKVRKYSDSILKNWERISAKEIKRSNDGTILALELPRPDESRDRELRKYISKQTDGNPISLTTYGAIRKSLGWSAYPKVLVARTLVKEKDKVQITISDNTDRNNFSMDAATGIYEVTAEKTELQIMNAHDFSHLFQITSEAAEQGAAANP